MPSVRETYQRIRPLIRWTVRTANRPIAVRRFDAAVAKAARPISLEIGGLQTRPGWIVVNVNATAPLYMDGTRPWVFEDDALSHVYADNMIEHVPLDGARRFFAEAARCLRPGGTIRLVTPDIRYHVDMYLAGPEAMNHEMVEVYRRTGARVEHPIDLIRTPIGEFGHHAGYVYDLETIDAELQRAGFAPAERRVLGDSPDPMLCGIDKRHEDGPAQLVVEASIPSV